MAELDFSGYLADRPDNREALRGIPSPKHPDGKTYYMPSPSARFSLQLRRIMQLWGARGADRAPTAKELNELNSLLTDESGEQVEIERRLLGSALEEMLDDGITTDDLQKVVNVVMVKYAVGDAAAQSIIGSSGEAVARPNRATRRATAQKTAGPRSAKGSTAGGSRTRKPASSGSSTSPNGPAEARKAV